MTYSAVFYPAPAQTEDPPASLDGFSQKLRIFTLLRSLRRTINLSHQLLVGAPRRSAAAKTLIPEAGSGCAYLRRGGIASISRASSGVAISRPMALATRTILSMIWALLFAGVPSQ